MTRDAFNAICLYCLVLALTLGATAAFGKDKQCPANTYLQNGICWQSVIIPSPPGPPIPEQFQGKWCGQEHKYGPDTLIYGRQILAGCTEMEVYRHALVVYNSSFTLQCEPLEIILRRDYRYQYKGKCTVFEKGKGYLSGSNILEGTAWITADNLLVIKSKPKLEPKKEELEQSADEIWEQRCKPYWEGPLPRREEFFSGYNGGFSFEEVKKICSRLISKDIVESDHDRNDVPLPRSRSKPCQLPQRQIDTPAECPGTIFIYNDHGGMLNEYVDRWTKLAQQTELVAIVGVCVSGCTLVMSYIPRDRICFGDNGYLAFHMAGGVRDIPVAQSGRNG